MSVPLLFETEANANWLARVWAGEDPRLATEEQVMTRARALRVQADFFNPYHDELGRFTDKWSAASGFGQNRFQPNNPHGYFSGVEGSLGWHAELSRIEPERQRAGWLEYMSREHPNEEDPAVFLMPKDPLREHEGFRRWWEEGMRSSIKARGAQELDDALGEAFRGEPPDFIVNGAIWQDAWARTSNDAGAAQDELQLEALRRAQNPAGIAQTSPGLSAALQEDANKVIFKEEHRKARAAVYDSVYQRTQQMFAEEGLGPDDTLVLYRGMKFPTPTAAWRLPGEKRDLEVERLFNDKPGALKMKANPLSSWALNRESAAKYAQDAEYGYFGVLVAARVKVRDIFSHWKTGFGCASEDEVIVLGDALAHTTLTKVGYSGRDR